MNERSAKIRTQVILILLAAMIVVSITSCEDESDMAVNKVASPVLLNVKNTGANEVTAYFYELDKSGILDHTVGIDSIPVSNLAIEVFASSLAVGTFTTDASGSFVISYNGTKPNEYTGSHKGIAFRIKK
jgi:uncharacterized lipoprotein YehR (DUF1307 family)